MSDSPLVDQLTRLLAQAETPVLKAVFFLVDQGSPLFWPYLLAAALLGYLGWRRFERQTGEGFGDFHRRHFAAKVWGHASARADYRFYVFNAVIFAVAIGPLLLSNAWLSDLLRGALIEMFGPGPAWSVGIGVRVLYTILFFVAYDLGRWVAHTLLHEVPLFWEFHKVHHSAEVLTPVTAFRVHPLDLLLTLSAPAVTTAPVLGLFTWLYPHALNAYAFLGLNFVIGFSGLIANLKHSQIWFSYGWMDNWWISPAHHQIHHSADPAHWGKNRGFEIGVWDRWYGSLHIPTREAQAITYGLGDGTDGGEWHHVSRLYLRPFAGAVRLLMPALRKRATTTAAIIALLVLPWPDAHAAPVATSVYLDDLTWPELGAAISAGSTTVLVPIGGTEQNGPGMAFSKHNLIVRHAAGEIARRVGHVVVAPVLPFAPEGGMAPRTGNQLWPGTIGLREETLIAVLEDEVASLALAGFRTIVFVGDHGGSQHAQADVAKRLGTTLASRRVVVASLDRYYEPAPLAARVKAVGIDPALAGDHAGLVDTSELLAVAPERVHLERLDPQSWNLYPATPGPGASGRPDLTTPELGRALLEQRIAAAVIQLQSLVTAKAAS